MAVDLKIEPQFDPQKTFGNLDAQHVQKATKASIEAAIGEIKELVGEAFDKEQTPGGNKWQALSANYAKAKARKYPGKKILEREGNLKAAATDPSVEWGDSDQTDTGGSGGDPGDKAQVTATLTVKDKKAYLHNFGQGQLPARPFFQFEGDAQEKIEKKAFAAFDKAIE
jgi:phage gpG-like protein